MGSPNAATGTITNDDLPTISVRVSPTSVIENGTPNLVYTFTRTGSTNSALSNVNFGVGGTATFSSDYTQTGASSYNATTGRVNFAAGSATATVTVNPTEDTTVEPNETAILTLSTGTGYTVGSPNAATGTITNDDTNLEWVKQLGTSSNFDYATDVAVDGLGNVYVVGYTSGQLLGDNAGITDGFLIKYNSTGTLQWIQEIETSTNDRVNAVAVDNAGNIYIGGTGSSASVAAQVPGDAFIAKFDGNGNREWLRRLGATDAVGGLAEVNDLTVDKLYEISLQEQQA